MNFITKNRLKLNIYIIINNLHVNTFDMAEPVVVIDKIQKIYDNGLEALKSISFSVNEGEIFGLIGVNGAGKTTLIRIITTMLNATSGSASIWGLDPAKEPERVRSIIGVLPQETGLYEEFSIRENLQFIAEMQGVPKEDIPNRVKDVCHIMDITDRLDDRTDQLSGGLKQRAMIARTLLGLPRILILDEPTTGLDVLVARRVRQTIKKLSKAMTIFIATHNMAEAFDLCDRVAIIKDGTILRVDTPQALMDEYATGDMVFEDVIADLLGIDQDREINISAMMEGLQ